MLGADVLYALAQMSNATSLASHREGGPWRGFSGGARCVGGGDELGGIFISRQGIHSLCGYVCPHTMSYLSDI